MIHNLENKYPNLEQCMDQCLYQEAAPTMAEAIEVYLYNGKEIVNSVIREIDLLLDEDFSEEELLAYIENHSDYIVNDSGRDTVKFIKNVLCKGINRI